MDASQLCPATLFAQQVAPFLPCTIRCSWWTSSNESYTTTCEDVIRVFNRAVQDFHIPNKTQHDPIQSDFTILAIKGRKVVWRASCKPHEFPIMRIGNPRQDSPEPEEEDNSRLHKAYAQRFSQLRDPNKELHTNRMGPT